MGIQEFLATEHPQEILYAPSWNPSTPFHSAILYERHKELLGVHTVLMSWDGALCLPLGKKKIGDSTEHSENHKS